MPIVRIKSINNEDYYIDDHYQIMPNTNYTSDIIIATGYINKWFAKKYISLLSKALMTSELWRNQIEQINVLPDRGIELVPRVGNHIVYLAACRRPITLTREKKTLIPTELGFIVTQMMEDYFKEIVDTGFTARWKINWMK